jgi:drug/metabolite transporter (DMT)-like permease
MTAAATVNPGLNFIGLGVAAAVFWGASDFLGGLATRKAHVVLVVAMAHSLSLGLLLLIAGATRSPLPPSRYALLGICAGAFGGVALILYYQALSLGEMGLTTALAGLLTALVPVIFSFVTQGSPKYSQMAGFVLAAAAIGLIAYAPAGKPRSLALGLATLAGLGFGVFLVVLQIARPPSLLWQLIYSRVASATLAGGMVIWVQVRSGNDAATWRRQEQFRNYCGLIKIARCGFPWKKTTKRPVTSVYTNCETAQARENRFLWIAGAAGVLEATGSLLYMGAARHGRLDVAAVLASLYPVATILLAAWFLKERTTLSQALGMALALGAVVLVSI